MKFEPAKLWKPGDDIWDLCEEQGLERLALKGIFTPEKLCARTGDLIQRAVAPNTILNSAINEIFLGANPRNHYPWIAVGDNGTPADPTDAGLKHVISIANGGNTNSAYTEASQDWGEWGWSYTAYWPSQYGNGELAEVGMKGSSIQFLTFNYLNRALFLDENGQQITIPKDAGHVLRITVQFQFRPNGRT